MSSLPRIAEYTRERIAREFDNLGPDACLAEIMGDLRQNNPELLDMASKCAADVGSPPAIMVGFGMFYRLLVAEASAGRARVPQAREGVQVNFLPRVTPETRGIIVRQIEQTGSKAFTRNYLDHLEQNNPELLHMAHDFASRHEDYLGTMQGFILLYASLIAQADADRAYLQ
jgi:hypothetical protein